MANAIKWDAVGTSRSTGISSSSMNAGANLLSSEIDNTTNLDRWMDLELTWTCGTATTANTVTEFYILSALDGTNYEDGDASPIDPAKEPDGFFPARGTVTSAQKVTRTRIPIPPTKFKILLKSEFSQNATSVKLLAYTYNEEIQ